MFALIDVSNFTPHATFLLKLHLVEIKCKSLFAYIQKFAHEYFGSCIRQVKCSIDNTVFVVRGRVNK